MKKICLLFLLAVVTFAMQGAQGAQSTSDAAPPRIAVWNPVTGSTQTRFRLGAEDLDRAAGVLRDAGMHVKRLTSQELNEPQKFSRAGFDVLVLPGETFPAANVAALRDFTEAGGVLVALRTSVPFLIAIAPGPDGLWTMSPEQPAFAWQKPDIMELFGLKYSYKPELHDSGTQHTPSPLLGRFLPGASAIERTLPGRYIYNTPDAAIYPLLRSQRLDGADVTPQIYFARKGKRTALVIGEGFATTGVANWPKPEAVLPALMRIATGVARGRIALEEIGAVSGLGKLTLPLPLESRSGALGVEFPGTKALQRWGRFNGSSLDLKTDGAGLTSMLTPGSTLRLPLTAAAVAGEPVFLRVRGAFNATGAGLKIAFEGAGESRVVSNEIFNYIDARSAGNFNAGLAGFPTEFSRLLFVPPGSAKTLVVSNPGKQPVYFDAMQLETRTAPAPERILGLGHGPVYSIPREVSRRWSSIRVNPRPQFVGPPGDPKRWQKMDAAMKIAGDSNASVHLVLEGTAEWNAISPERYALGVQAKRPHTVPPDPRKFAELVGEIIERYGQRVDIYEIWNEPDIQQYWRGTASEYIALFDAVEPVIRRLDPTAKVVMAGMSGFNDHWIRAMVAGNVPQRCDLFAFHPYAGKTAGWDTVYGLARGTALSLGQGIEFFCDESGFVSTNVQWFQPPPNWTPQTQARYLDIAMARLLANDLAKLSIFNSGGDGNPFGLFDGKGQPLPSYRVFEDYLPLGQNGGRLQGAALVSQDGTPLQGVYTAASSHSDGSVTLVINPAEVEGFTPPVNPSYDFDTIGGWTTFFGKSRAQNGQVTVTPEAGKPYAGFYTRYVGRAADFPLVELNVPSCEGGYDLIFKLEGGRRIQAVTRQAAGIWKGDLRRLLPPGTRDFEISLRIYGPTTFDYLHFTADGTPEPPSPLAVRVLVPLPRTGNYVAESTGSTPATLKVHSSGQWNWAEVALSLNSRTRLTLRPAP